jgi:glycosyltransferase involved in cell wall biosynthesis
MAEKYNLVSVIIPYYNKVNTIERSVDSVINQSYSNWEIIIVDDCSKIKLRKLEKWENYNITILYNEINLGPGPSRQKALDLSKGEYVAFLDADDWWENRFLELSIDVHINSFNNIAFTWTKTKTLYSNGEIRERKNNHLNLNQIRETLIKYGHPWSTSSILWNRKFCSNWKDLTTNQDSLFEFDSSLLNNNVICINQTLCTKDETVGNNRVDIIKREIMIVNRYYLYSYFFKKGFKKFNLFYKIVLFNRFVWCIVKLNDVNKMNLFFKFSLVSKIIFLISKFLHKFLQKTSYKIQIGQ